MKINCPRCHQTIEINAGGRKPFCISVKNISDALQANQNVVLAAKELGCSRGYIYQELGKRGLKPQDVIERKAYTYTACQKGQA